MEVSEVGCWALMTEDMDRCIRYMSWLTYFLKRILFDKLSPVPVPD